MNKYLACTVALLMPVALSAQALAQTGMAHSTMAPGTMAPNAAAPAAGMAGTMAPAGTANLSAIDKKFVMKAAQGGMAEVQMAQLAQTRPVRHRQAVCPDDDR